MKKNTQITYQCEICDSSYDSPTKAKKCEEQHLKRLEESKTHCLVACNREKFPTYIHLEDINDNGLMNQSNILALPFVTSCGATFWCAPRKSSLFDYALTKSFKFCPHCGKPIKRCSIETLEFVKKKAGLKGKLNQINAPEIALHMSDDKTIKTPEGDPHP